MFALLKTVIVLAIFLNIDLSSRGMIGDLPHLTLYESQSRESGVACVPDRESLRSMRIIRYSFYEIVPDLSIAIECPAAVAVEADITAS